MICFTHACYGRQRCRTHREKVLLSTDILNTQHIEFVPVEIRFENPVLWVFKLLAHIFCLTFAKKKKKNPQVAFWLLHNTEGEM